jgi:hypothetical protein
MPRDCPGRQSTPWPAGGSGKGAADEHVPTGVRDGHGPVRSADHGPHPSLKAGDRMVGFEHGPARGLAVERTRDRGRVQAVPPEPRPDAIRGDRVAAWRSPRGCSTSAAGQGATRSRWHVWAGLSTGWTSPCPLCRSTGLAVSRGECLGEMSLLTARAPSGAGVETIADLRLIVSILLASPGEPIPSRSTQAGAARLVRALGTPRPSVSRGRMDEFLRRPSVGASLPVVVSPPPLGEHAPNCESSHA